MQQTNLTCYCASIIGSYVLSELLQTLKGVRRNQQHIFWRLFHTGVRVCLTELLYIDKFQNFITPTMEGLLSGARR